MSILRSITKFVFSHKKLLALILIGVVLGIIAYGYINYASKLAAQPGALGRDMLSVVPYWGEVIEIDYQADAVPDKAAIDMAVGFVGGHSGKQVSVVLQEIPAGGPQPLQPCPLPVCSTGTISDAEIVALAKQYRDVIPLPGQIAVHYLYVDRPSEHGPTVLAISYCATCVVVFKPVVTTGGGGYTNYEAAVVAHEHGHLWGLCALVYNDVRNHCDGTGHSTNSISLMYPSLSRNNANQMNLYLDPDDLADLSDLAWGKL
jgi:hypothetical protein